jgi:hypothetical protein
MPADMQCGRAFSHCPSFNPSRKPDWVRLPSQEFYNWSFVRFGEKRRRHMNPAALIALASGAKNSFGPSLAALANSAPKEVFIPTSP